MGIGAIAVDAIREWNPLGPAAYRRREINKAFRKARRKSRRGEPLTDDERQTLTAYKEIQTMIPQGKATYTGAALGAASPFIGLMVAMVATPLENLIVAASIAPAMCEPDAQSCVSAGMMAVAVATGVVTSIASWIVAWGRSRAEKRHAADLAAAQAKPAP